MRKVLFLFCSMIGLCLVSACGNQTNDAIQLGEEFIERAYNIDETGRDLENMGFDELVEAQVELSNEFSAFLTEKEFNNLSVRRFFWLPHEVSSRLDAKISVNHVVLEEDVDVQSDDGSRYFDHSFTIIVTDTDGKQIDKTTVKGQMTIVDTEDGLKIDRYFERNTLPGLLGIQENH